MATQMGGGDQSPVPAHMLGKWCTLSPAHLLLIQHPCFSRRRAEQVGCPYCTSETEASWLLQVACGGIGSGFTGVLCPPPGRL